jgi:hypothetical protein
MTEIVNQLLSVTKKQKKNKPSILLDIIEEPINTEDAYTIIRKTFRSSEYIPSKNIHIVMKHHFESSELLFSYNDNHGIYKIKVKDLLIDTITNWEFNRPPDMERCPDIARYIYNSRKPIDTMIFLSFNNLKENFEVIDGIHRITALKMIKEENSKPLDYLCHGDFGSGNDATWLYEQYLLVNIRFNTSKGDLIGVFENLNKSQTVSELYICDHSKEKKEMIESIVEEWYQRFKKHFSSTSNPVTGNTNKTKFTNLLLHLYDKHKIRQSNAEKLKKILENANIRISKNIPDTVSSLNIRVKCKDSGCYLFLLKNDVLEEFI